MLKYPELYKTSQNALDFNTKVGAGSQHVCSWNWSIWFSKGKEMPASANSKMQAMENDFLRSHRDSKGFGWLASFGVFYAIEFRHHHNSQKLAGSSILIGHTEVMGLFVLWLLSWPCCREKVTPLAGTSSPGLRGAGFTYVKVWVPL